MAEDQDAYMDLASASHEYEIEEEDSSSWMIQQSFSLPTVLPEPKISTSNSCLALPELPLQPSISSELELLSDFHRQEVCLGTNQVGNVDQEVNQCEGLAMWPPSIRQDDNQGNDQIKRSRSAQVHSVSERKRRHKINGKIKVLQELLPHCDKKDKASVLEAAAKHIKALKHQVKTMMSNPYGIDCTAPHMQYLMRGRLSPCMTVTPGFGMVLGADMRVACSAPIVPPIVQLPLACLPFSSYSANVGVPFSTPSPMAVAPIAGNGACVRQPYPHQVSDYGAFVACSEQQQPSYNALSSANAIQCNPTSFSSGLQAGGRPDE